MFLSSMRGTLFQSTHPRRVRQIRGDVFHPFPCFNPRTHVGCDSSSKLGLYPKPMFQSTHPRRVRLVKGFRHIIAKCFNPRTHVGCDYKCFDTLVRQRSFNPRTHVGCDWRWRFTLLFLTWFQSTHPRRVRPDCRSWFCKAGSCFNPRTHVGCDSNGTPLPYECYVSIHAPT